MKIYLFLPLLFAISTGVPCPAKGSDNITTNLVDIIPYIGRFAEALELELSEESVGTNSVTRFRPYLGFGRVCGVTIDERWGFQFDVKHSFVSAFTDRERSMNVLWKEEEIKPLILPSTIDKEGALQIARSYLEKLGYRESEYPVKDPEVNQWKWEPPGATEATDLPFFAVKWEWKHREGADFFSIQIDGLRKRVVYFSTLDKSFAVEDMERHLRTGQEITHPKQE